MSMLTCMSGPANTRPYIGTYLRAGEGGKMKLNFALRVPLFTNCYTPETSGTITSRNRFYPKIGLWALEETTSQEVGNPRGPSKCWVGSMASQRRNHIPEAGSCVFSTESQELSYPNDVPKTGSSHSLPLCSLRPLPVTREKSIRGVRGVEVTEEGGASTALEILDTEAKRPGEEAEPTFGVFQVKRDPLPLLCPQHHPFPQTAAS